MDSTSDQDLYLHANNHVVIRIKQTLTIEELDDSLTFIKSVLTPMIKTGTLSSNLPHKPPDRSFGQNCTGENSFPRGQYGQGNPFSSRNSRRSTDGYGDSGRGHQGRRFRSNQSNFYGNNDYSGGSSGVTNGEPERANRFNGDLDNYNVKSNSSPGRGQSSGSYGVAASGVRPANGASNSFQSNSSNSIPNNVTNNGDDESNRKRCRVDKEEHVNAPVDTSSTTRPPSDEGDDLDWIPRAVLKIESNTIDCTDSDDEN